jgi:hypothetical protein
MSITLALIVNLRQVGLNSARQRLNNDLKVSSFFLAVRRSNRELNRCVRD